MSWLAPDPWELVVAAVKAVLLFITALATLRLTDPAPWPSSHRSSSFRW